ncbi:HRDC domain-containing protein [Pedobacter aquatilis]|uniref:HRDC domain-containing protein n=1 Tax=Pedobacter aquatilis TaxID=351343 RepID=UPI00292DD462|nr:HRDC domain-containing protein [Pedobacter aquatilis]
MAHQHQLILDFLKSTNQPVFLTGKAGTGKTTLLKHIKETTEKNYAIVAPTAVAAINAGGVTLHSFFQIPFGPIIPDKEVSDDVKYSVEKIKLLKCLELLIIDEISMVRADVLDYIDIALRKTKAINRPFGGVQVLLIGDLYQLSPIAHDAWHILRNYYASPYFFDSKAIISNQLITFQLDKVYRQSDPTFLNILNGIRENTLSSELLAKLNERYDESLSDIRKEEYITLTTHNNQVTQINQEYLEKLDGETFQFTAKVTGDFPKDAYPIDEVLELKIGARVMFIKNDSSGKKLYYNGKAAIVIAVDGDVIKVSFDNDTAALEINREEWQNVKYNLDGENKISEVNTGSFTQFPFKLAWAITVHKSQGLTFDKANIDVSSSFTHGQAYVALSRCRSLDGLILKSPVKPENIITDDKVIRFTNDAILTTPSAETLAKSSIDYEWNLIHDLLDFSALSKNWQLLKKSNFPNHHENQAFHTIIGEISKPLENEIIAIGERFIKKELSEQPKSTIVKENQTIVERLTKAAQYFKPKLKSMLDVADKFNDMNVYRDERAEKILSRISDFVNDLTIKTELFKISWTNFSADEFAKVYHKAGSKYEHIQTGRVKKAVELPKEIVNQQLYNELISLRKKISEKRNVQEHNVLSDQTLQVIAAKLPKTTEQLAAIKGVGVGNAVEIGKDILRLVNGYLGTTELF